MEGKTLSAPSRKRSWIVECCCCSAGDHLGLDVIEVSKLSASEREATTDTTSTRAVGDPVMVPRAVPLGDDVPDEGVKNQPVPEVPEVPEKIVVQRK
eukprot:865626-Amphidinium_carterae.1